MSRVVNFEVLTSKSHRIQCIDFLKEAHCIFMCVVAVCPVPTKINRIDDKNDVHFNSLMDMTVSLFVQLPKAK